jgi:putative hemolysin
LLLILIITLLSLGALLAASETALFSLVRMEHTRAKLAGAVREALDRLMRRPLESLVTIIGLNEATNVFAVCLATSLLIDTFGRVGLYFSGPLMFVVVLLFGEITPKTFALAFPDLVARITARPLAALTELVHPIAKYFTPLTETPTPEPVSETEFRALLSASEIQGEVEAGERELIHKVLDFGTRRVSEVMIPRKDIFSLDLNTPPERLIAEVARGHFSRIPIFRDDPGNIVGVLHVKDLVARRLERSLPRLERLMRPPYFVPPSLTLGQLFEDMRRNRVQLALVVNEYGNLLGLITLEDLLEEVFGEIKDEFDVEGPEMTRAADGSWLVAGTIDLARLREMLAREGISVSDGDGDGDESTLGRLIVRRLGRVPRAGERLHVGNLEIAVERVRGASVELARIRPWS